MLLTSDELMSAAVTREALKVRTAAASRIAQRRAYVVGMDETLDGFGAGGTDSQRKHFKAGDSDCRLLGGELQEGGVESEGDEPPARCNAERAMTDNEYLCLTLVANASEAEAAFKARLTVFWTYLLRTAPDTYEAVFAEAKAFGVTGGRAAREYMVEANAAEAVSAALTANGIATLPLDPDDVYSKYEASGSEWFQIPH
jgi:hypothetical protein